MPIEVITDGLVLTETEDVHEYRLDGKIIPGCTSVLARAGYCDLSMVKPEVLKAKSQLGSMVHEITHFWDEDDYDIAQLDNFPAYQNRLKGWIQFRQDWDFSPRMIEQPMAIRINGMVFGVKPDRFGVGNFGVSGVELWSTVEIKCTAEIERSHEIQTAAQALALKEVTPLPGRIICQLLDTAGKDGRFYRIHKCEDRNDEKIWLCCLALDIDKRNNKLIK